VRRLSFEEVSTLPCAAVTAWVALTRRRRVTAGDTVLTQGSGGVSVFALQFAQILGARVIATTSTAEKAERLRALGASEVINYSETPDWDAKARELTDGLGIDCVVEIGGPGTIAKSLKALAVGGHVSLIGASLSPSGIMLDPLLLTGRGITLGSISVGSRADFEAINRAIALHGLRPVIDKAFSFAEAKAAYRHFEGRGHFGKVVITHGRSSGIGGAVNESVHRFDGSGIREVWRKNLRLGSGDSCEFSKAPSAPRSTAHLNGAIVRFWFGRFLRVSARLGPKLGPGPILAFLAGSARGAGRLSRQCHL
jgi:hypothetical protein